MVQYEGDILLMVKLKRNVQLYKLCDINIYFID